MNCLESRRLLLACPRRRSPKLRAHIAVCAACGRFAATLAALERDFDDVLLTPLPDGISDRVLLMARRQWSSSRVPGWLRGITAVAAIAAFAAALFLSGLRLSERAGASSTITVVGAEHPAVAAIAEAVHESRPISPVQPQAAADMSRGFARLGLNAPTGETRADYVGRCHIARSSECAHVVLTTRGERASVMLVADYPAAERVLVSDQRMFALMNSTGDGVYIVVAQSAATAKRMERFLVNG
jgi:hypothetical protein